MSDYNTKRRARNEKCVDSVTDAKKSVKKSREKTEVCILHSDRTEFCLLSLCMYNP